MSEFTNQPVFPRVNLAGAFSPRVSKSRRIPVDPKTAIVLFVAILVWAAVIGSAAVLLGWLRLPAGV